MFNQKANRIRILGPFGNVINYREEVHVDFEYFFHNVSLNDQNI